VNFFSGSQLAVAIEDLANRELSQAELVLSERIIDQICEHLPYRRVDVPRRLINGFMRGSTAIKDEQLSDEIQGLLRQVDLKQDPLLLVSIIKNALDRERKDLHIRRTQKSAVRQVLRAIKDDLENTPTTKPEMVSSFIRSQQELLSKEIKDAGAVYTWADDVLSLYFDLFADLDKSITHATFNPKGIVSRPAANNYGNAWMRFIKDHLSELFETAATSKPLMSSAYMDSSFGSSFNLNRSSHVSEPRSQEVIRVAIENTGQGAIKFEKKWSSKSEAREGLTAFFALLTTLVDPNERIDLVEISIESTNGVSLSLQEVTADKIKNTLNKLLSA
jgi:hypothetical protein